ncbi:hypothetical protein T440DRAFT_514382 [Plenodomus tracheiphilus IPT5]|uniref:Uncharacterized protein n=1 Tax=Plenodomus tracheiphilus IPT5 TaxID=1408161 RepID=A0A6A7BGH5_9PLEO|nr:hypothetical protein T440DRAFT_514382 [Plenodomus tracheiphilus IPT5]
MLWGNQIVCGAGGSQGVYPIEEDCRRPESSAQMHPHGQPLSDLAAEEELPLTSISPALPTIRLEAAIQAEGQVPKLSQQQSRQPSDPAAWSS